MGEELREVLDDFAKLEGPEPDARAFFMELFDLMHLPMVALKQWKANPFSSEREIDWAFKNLVPTINEWRAKQRGRGRQIVRAMEEVLFTMKDDILDSKGELFNVQEFYERRELELEEKEQNINNKNERKE